MMHAPWYNTNTGHWKESEFMRNDMETLLYQYGVDLVLSGHVHAYERSYPVFHEVLDNCAPTYINIGDGGNYEGPYVPWRSGFTWSAFREGSFGVASLEVVNATYAHYRCGIIDHLISM